MPTFERVSEGTRLLLEADSAVALDEDHEIAGIPQVDAIADTVDGETMGKVIPNLKQRADWRLVLGTPAAAQKAGIAVKEIWSQPDAERLHKLAEDFVTASCPFRLPSGCH